MWGSLLSGLVLAGLTYYPRQGPPRPPAYFVYTVSAAPTVMFPDFYPTYGVGGDVFVGGARYHQLALGLSASVGPTWDAGAIDPWVFQRYQFTAQGRGGPTGRFYWRTGAGGGVISGAMSVVSTTLRLGYWRRARGRRTDLLIAGQLDFDLAMEHLIHPVFSVSVHIGFGRQ